MVGHHAAKEQVKALHYQGTYLLHECMEVGHRGRANQLWDYFECRGTSTGADELWVDDNCVPCLAPARIE